MPALSIPNSFTPFTKIRSADVNSNFTAITTLLNTTKLDDTNLQDAGISISKIKKGTGTAGQFLANDGTNLIWTGNPLTSQYNVVIGSAAQVTAGTATHSTFASYTPVSGDRILILPGYATTENVSLNVSKLYLRGLGAGSLITGTLTLGASATDCICADFRITDNVTVTGNSNTMTGIVFATGKTWTDNSTGSFLQGIQE